MDTSKPLFDDTNPSGTAEASSATGMFGKLNSEKIGVPSEDDLLKRPLQADAPLDEGTPVEPTVIAAAKPDSSGPGEFTQMFQALNSETPTQRVEMKPPVTAPGPPSSKTPADLTSVFTPVILGGPSAPAVAASADGRPIDPAKPGESTHILQALNDPVIKPESSPPPSVMPEAPKPGAEQGSFTRMFQALSADKPTTAPAPSLPTEEPVAEGGFTKTFEALSSKKEEPQPQQISGPEPKSGPGAFTHMFQQIGSQSHSQSDPPAMLGKEQAPGTGFRSGPASEPATSLFREPTASPPRTPSSQQGGDLTQLFEALGNENSASRKESKLLVPSAAPASSESPAAGGFTQLLRTLNANPAPQPPLTPHPSAPQSVPPTMPAAPAASTTSSGGAGEFTRVISGSMLREAHGQGSPPTPSTMPLPTATGGGQSPFQTPPLSGMPRTPTAAPSSPPMPIHGGGQAPQIPHLQPPAFPFPQPPTPPAAQPSAPSKLQQYLPLILVLNVFVMIVLILIMIFSLQHH